MPPGGVLTCAGGQEFVTNGGGAFLCLCSPSALVIASLKNHGQAEASRLIFFQLKRPEQKQEKQGHDQRNRGSPAIRHNGTATPKAPTQPPPPPPPCQPNPKCRRMATPEEPVGSHRPRQLAAEQPCRRRRTARSMHRRWASRPG